MTQPSKSGGASQAAAPPGCATRAPPKDLSDLGKLPAHSTLQRQIQPPNLPPSPSPLSPILRPLVPLNFRRSSPFFRPQSLGLRFQKQTNPATKHENSLNFFFRLSHFFFKNLHSHGLDPAPQLKLRTSSSSRTADHNVVKLHQAPHGQLPQGPRPASRR